MLNYKNLICLIVAIIASKTLFIQAIWPFDKPSKFNAPDRCGISPLTDPPIRCGEHVPLTHERVKNRSGYAEAPFLANIQIKIDTANITTNCSGVLLDKDVLLTSLKCVEDYRGSSITIIVGSFNKKNGQKVVVRRFDNYNISQESGDCGHTDIILHGLALIYFKESVNFSLKKNRKDIYINSACRQKSKLFNSLTTLYEAYKGKTFELFNWMPADNCAKRIQVKFSYCNTNSKNNTNNGQLDRLLCFQDTDGNFVQDDLQEGSPILTNIDGRWVVVGIASKEADLFQRCELGHNEKTRFIPIQLKNITESFYLPGSEL